MKTMTFILLLMTAVFSGCGGEGGTETGTTNGVAARIEAAGDALIPSLDASGISEQASLPAPFLRKAVDGTADDWETYLDPDNAYVLTDVFGSPDETPAVVTKIRVLLEHLAGNVQTVFSQDPLYLCEGGTALADSDQIELAFYGLVANGDASNRAFDCQSGSDVIESDDDETIIYGEDAAGVVRIATMSDSTSVNTEESSTRGDQKRIMAVNYATYAETTEADGDVVYVDLQFAHGSSYNGVDDEFGTDDDVIFKSRSRITGRVVFDLDGNASVGAGDFTVTKYDESQDAEGNINTTVTKTIGRGSFGQGAYSLFKVDSNVWTLEDLDGTFCIQMPAEDTGLPTAADSANCTALETAFAWGSASFPFTPAPMLDETFDSKEFFEGDDTDMVANDGSNFTIPTY